MKKAVTDFMDYLPFLKELVKRDFKKKYYKSVLGVLWTVLNPLLMMLVITIVFSTLFRRNIPNYPVYYLSGYVIFNFVSSTTRSSLHCIIGNANWLRKIYVPKYMFCLSTVLNQLITLLFSLIPMVLVMLVSGMHFTKYFLLLPVPIFYTLVFTTGLSLLLCSYNVFFRDLDHLYGIFVTVWMYLSALFYPISIIPQQFRFLWDLNPLYIFITIMRDVVYGSMPSEKMLLVATCYSFLTLLMGIVVFREKENRFILHM